MFEPSSSPNSAGRPIDPRSAQFPAAGQPPTVLADGEIWDPHGPGRGFAVASLVFSAIATLIPFVGIIAAGFAFAAKDRNDPWARTLLIVAGSCAAIGFAISAMAISLEARGVLSIGL